MFPKNFILRLENFFFISQDSPNRSPNTFILCFNKLSFIVYLQKRGTQLRIVARGNHNRRHALCRIGPAGIAVGSPVTLLPTKPECSKGYPTMAHRMNGEQEATAEAIGHRHSSRASTNQRLFGGKSSVHTKEKEVLGKPDNRRRNIEHDMVDAAQRQSQKLVPLTANIIVLKHGQVRPDAPEDHVKPITQDKHTQPVARLSQW